MSAAIVAKRRVVGFLVACLAVVTAMVGLATPAMADPPVNVNFQQLIFNPANVTNINGDGKNNGDLVLWKDVITVNGVTVDALVSTTLSNTTVATYGTGGAGVPGDFRVNLVFASTSATADFGFSYFRSGTYPSAPVPLSLENVQVTAKDIDLRQFNSFTGARGYTTSSPTNLTITKTPADPATWPSDLKFAGAIGDRFDDPKDQAVVSYDSVASTTVTMGRPVASATPQFFALTWKFVGFGASGTTSQGPEVTVSYNTNGGTGTTPSSVTGVFGQQNGTVDDGAGLAKPGYTLLEWNTSCDGSGTSYPLSSVLTMPAVDTTLCAVWAGVYTINYDGNTSTSGNPPVDGSYTTGGPAYVIEGNTGTPPLEKTGYSFAGWNTSADGSGTPWSPGDNYANSANLTLYAQWSLIPTATLTVNVLSRGTEVTTLDPIAEAYDGVEVELSKDDFATIYKTGITDTLGTVDFGNVDPNVATYRIRLKAPCDSRPVETKDVFDIVTGPYTKNYDLAATVPCAPVLSYNAAFDTMTWTVPNDGGSRIRYYTYQYQKPSVSQTWGIYARFWPAAPASNAVDFSTQGGPIPACPSKAAAPFSPAPYDTAPQCGRTLGAPSAGTLFNWRVGARNAVNQAGVNTPAPFNGLGWGQNSNVLPITR